MIKTQTLTLLFLEGAVLFGGGCRAHFPSINLFNGTSEPIVVIQRHPYSWMPMSVKKGDAAAPIPTSDGFSVLTKDDLFEYSSVESVARPFMKNKSTFFFLPGTSRMEADAVFTCNGDISIGDCIVKPEESFSSPIRIQQAITK